MRRGRGALGRMSEFASFGSPGQKRITNRSRTTSGYVIVSAPRPESWSVNNPLESRPDTKKLCPTGRDGVSWTETSPRNPPPRALWVGQPAADYTKALGAQKTGVPFLTLEVGASVMGRGERAKPISVHYNQSERHQTVPQSASAANIAMRRGYRLVDAGEPETSGPFKKMASIYANDVVDP